MGLADQLFAGLGQGLSSGMTGYSQGLAQQHQDARQAEADRMAREHFTMQQRDDEFNHAYKLNTLLQQDAGNAASREDWAGVSAMAPGINQYRQQMGLAALPVPTGTHQPAQAATPMGPQWSGEAMGLAARPERTEYSDQDKQGLMTLANYTPPKQEFVAYGADQNIYKKDARGNLALVGTTPAKREAGFTLGPDQVRVGADGGIIARGPSRPQTPKTKLVQQPDGTWVQVAAGSQTAPPTPRPADQKQNALLLQTAQGLAGKFGGQITSSGVRPVGSKSDTGATLVNGHQTQWGLYNEYKAGRGALAAYPGTSDHGNGNAIDLFVPAPARAAFEREAANLGLGVLSEVDGQGNHHYHLTAPAALAPVKAPPRAGLRQDPKTGQWFQPREGEVTSVRNTGLGSLEAGSQDATGQAILKILADRKKAGQ